MNNLDDIALPSIALAVLGLAISASVAAFNPTAANAAEVVQLERVVIVAKRLPVNDPLACDSAAAAQQHRSI
jgi:hypothetical protein